MIHEIRIIGFLAHNTNGWSITAVWCKFNRRILVNTSMMDDDILLLSHKGMNSHGGFIKTDIISENCITLCLLVMAREERKKRGRSKKKIRRHQESHKWQLQITLTAMTMVFGYLLKILFYECLLMAYW